MAYVSMFAKTRVRMDRLAGHISAENYAIYDRLGKYARIEMARRYVSELADRCPAAEKNAAFTAAMKDLPTMRRHGRRY